MYLTDFEFGQEAVEPYASERHHHLGLERLKLTQLEEDSRLGHSPLTGSKNKIVAIQPPVGFGKEIWLELKEKGFLKDDGGGFYQLVPGK